MMTVRELIEHLKTLPGDMPVAYDRYSEQCLMEVNEITVQDLCHPREDGWIQDKRPDMPTIKYVVFPGN
jgi:hypothetical protein